MGRHLLSSIRGQWPWVGLGRGWAPGVPEQSESGMDATGRGLASESRTAPTLTPGAEVRMGGILLDSGETLRVPV